MQKANSRKLAASVALAAASVALLLGLTFAWFTDSVKNEGNRIQAGTLGIELSTTGDGGVILASDGRWEPGYSEKADATVSNAGSLWLKYAISVDNLQNAGGANLSDVLDVYAVADGATSLEGATLLGNLTDLSAGDAELAAEGVLAPKDYAGSDGSSSKALSLVVKMRESAGNEYQGASVAFDIVVKATQAAKEQDGFGNDRYDANAQFPMTDEEVSDAINGDLPNVTIARNIVTTRDDKYAITSDKVVDFTGCQVLRSADGDYFTIGGDEPVNATIQNAVFKSQDSSNKRGAVRVEGSSTVTFENCSFSGIDDMYAEAFQSYPDSTKITLVFNNCTFDSKVNIDSSADGSEYDVTFNNCTFTGNFGRDAAVITGVNAYGNITFNGCTIDIVNASTGTVDGVNLGIRSGANEMVGTFNNTTVKVDFLYQYGRGVPVGTWGTPSAKGRIVIGDGCSFFYKGVEKTYDSASKSWVDKA